MTFSRAKSGGWVTGERLTSTQMNTLDTNMVKAVDGDAGGTYTPSAALSITDLECPTTASSDDDVVNKSFLESRTLAATYAVSGTAEPSTTEFTLTEGWASTGFSDSSNLLTMPSTGVYLVSLYANIKTDSTGANAEIPVILYGGTALWTGTTAMARFTAERISSTTTDPTLVAGTQLLRITNTTNEKLWLGCGSLGDLSLDYTENKLQFYKINDS